MAHTSLVSVKTPQETNYFALTIDNIDEPTLEEFFSGAFQIVTDQYQESLVTYAYRNQWTQKSFKVRIQGPERDVDFVAEVEFVLWEILSVIVSV